MRGIFSVLWLGLVSISTVEAASPPPCNDVRGSAMSVDNARILNLKKSTKNQYRDRGYIQGTLVGVLQDRKSHLHLDVFLGETPSGRGRDSDIEIIYNRAFDEIDGRSLRPGAEVIACGDFINSFAPAGRYPASPVGAILHWTHMAPQPPHQHGFLMIDGKLYGQTDPQDRGPRGGDFNRLFDDEGEDFRLWPIAN